MSELSVVLPRSGEIVGDAPDRRVEILSDHEALHVTWTRFGPYRDGAELHVHREHTDFFYVLDGELTIMLGPDGDETRLGRGDLVQIPPHLVHGFRNASDARVRYLNLHAPGRGFADYLRGIRDDAPIRYDQFEPPADGGLPVSDAIVVRGGGSVAETPGARITLLADTEAATVAEIEAGSDAAWPPSAEHVHAGRLESVYVIDGTVTVSSPDRETVAAAGSWVQIPAGVPHALAFGASARALAVHAPGGRLAEFVRG